MKIARINVYAADLPGKGGGYRPGHRHRPHRGLRRPGAGRDGAVLSASTAPGLGLTPRMEVLGDPVAVIE